MFRSRHLAPPRGILRLCNLTIFILPLSLGYMVEYLAKHVRYLWGKGKLHPSFRFLIRINEAGQFLSAPPLLSPPEQRFFFNCAKRFNLTLYLILYFHKGYLEPSFPKILKRPLSQFFLRRRVKFRRLRNTSVASGTLSY